MIDTQTTTYKELAWNDWRKQAMLTTFWQIKSVWDECKQCPLHQTVSHHVVGDGVLPCEVMIVGESPGMQEDAVGKPFVGKSGHLLLQMIEQALAEVRIHKITFFMTNLVACRSCDFPDERGGRPPDTKEIYTCSPRLHQLFDIGKPKGIIFLGRLVQSYGREILHEKIKATKLEILDLPAPAAILRRGGVHAYDFQDQIAKLALFFELVKSPRELG